jgi:hypothetical protein
MKTAAPHRAPPVTARTQRGVTLTAFAAFLCCCRVRSTQGAGGRKRHAGVDRGMDNATTLCCRLTFMRHMQPRSHSRHSAAGCAARSTQGAGGRKRHAGVDRGMDNATTLCCRLTFMRHVQPRSHLPRTRSKACCRLSIMRLYCRVLQNQDCSSSLYCRVLENQDCSSPLYCRVPRYQDCSSSLYCRVPRYQDCSSPPRSARDRTHTTQGDTHGTRSLSLLLQGAQHAGGRGQGAACRSRQGTLCCRLTFMRHVQHDSRAH